MKNKETETIYPISCEELEEYLKERVGYDIGDYLPILLPGSFLF